MLFEALNGGGFEGQKIHQQIVPNIERNEIKAWMNGQISLEMPTLPGVQAEFWEAPVPQFR